MQIRREALSARAGLEGFDRQGALIIGSHRADIQGLRAVAVLAVVLFHTGGLLPGGFAGVDMFFVISGFVITGYLMRMSADGQRLRLRDFFWRRLARLGPLLGVVITVTIIASYWLLSPITQLGVAAKTGLGAVLLGANFVIDVTSGNYFDLAAESNPLLNLWSLSVEEQFYLLFAPIFVGYLLLRRRGHRRSLILLAFMLALALASLMVARQESLGWNPGFLPDLFSGFYGPIGRVWEFLIGALLALAWPLLLRFCPPFFAAMLGWTGVAAIAYTFLIVTPQVPWPGSTTILPTAGTACIILGAIGARFFPFTRVLSSHGAGWLGDRSYGWYLWHWPLIVLCSATWGANLLVEGVASAVALALAAITYVTIEAKYRRESWSNRAMQLKILGLSTLIPAGACALILLSNSAGFGIPRVVEFTSAIKEDHQGHSNGCDDAFNWSLDSCTWNSNAAGSPVYLVGDSNADHLSEALIGATQRENRSLVIRTAYACPLVRGAVSRADGDDQWREQCDRYRQDVEGFLSQAPPGTVVVSLSPGYEEGFRIDPELIQERAPLGTQGAAAAIAQVVAAISSRHEVVWVEPIAAPPWTPHDCSTIEIVTDGCLIEFRKPDIKAYNDLGSALRSALGATVVDPSQALCNGEVCRSVIDRLQVFRDPAHITADASRALQNIFAAPLNE